MSYRPPLLLDDEEKEQFLDWLAALESGAVPQTRGTLQDKAGFCCLGVAVALFVKNPSVYSDGHLSGGTPSGQTVAPRWLRQIVGHFRSHPRNKTGNGLIALNDGAEWSFKKIARTLRHVYKPELES